MDFTKYDPLSKKIDEPAIKQGSPALLSWQDSAPVVRLSEFLKYQKHHGFQLRMRGNQIVMQFIPPLTKEDIHGERGKMANLLMIALDEARDDLYDLIDRGLLSLPTIQPDMNTQIVEAAQIEDAAGKHVSNQISLEV